MALVKAGATGDKNLVRTSAEALIADERAKQHHILADRLVNALRSNGSPLQPSLPLEGVPRPSSIRDFFVEVAPRRRLDEVVLSVETREACDALIEEQRRADLLRSHGLEPRHRILLVGPPGNGKTTLAEAIAESLSVPLFVVRYESVIGSFLGETASRLRRVFDFARTNPCVLFFDEFDVVGKERGDVHETGEIKRVVSSLLLQVDDVPSWTIVAAATNHQELLDRAVWRRFQLRLNLPAPTESQIERFVVQYFDERYPLEFSRLTPELKGQIAQVLRGSSLAETEEFCKNILRHLVLSLGAESVTEIIRFELRQWRTQISPSKPNMKRQSGRAASTQDSETGAS